MKLTIAEGNRTVLPYSIWVSGETPRATWIPVRIAAEVLRKVEGTFRKGSGWDIMSENDFAVSFFYDKVGFVLRL